MKAFFRFVTAIFIFNFAQIKVAFANSGGICPRALSDEAVVGHYAQANINKTIANLLRDLDELNLQSLRQFQSNIQLEIFQFRIRGIESETEDLLNRLGLRWIPFMVPFRENLQLPLLKKESEFGLRRQYYLAEGGANPLLRKLLGGIYSRSKNWNIKIVIDPLLDDFHLVGFYDTDKNAIFLSLRSLIGGTEANLARFIRHEFHHALSALNSERPGSLIRKSYRHKSHEALPIGYEESFNLDEIDGHLRDLRVLKGMLAKRARVKDSPALVRNEMKMLQSDFEAEYETLCQFMNVTLGKNGLFTKLDANNLVWKWSAVNELGLIFDQAETILDQDGSQFKMWLLLDPSKTKQERIQHEIYLTKRRIDRVYSEILRIGTQYDLKCEI